MPQLDLTWFLFNFIIAWTLIVLVLSALSSQTWKTDTTPENETSLNTTPTNSWNW